MYRSASMWALLSAIGIFLVLGTSVPSALFSLVIVGVVPGTTQTLPLWIALTIYPLLSVGALYWLLREPLYIGEIQKPSKVTEASKKKIVIKKKTALKQTAVKRRPRIAA